jgi:hypothetical protein
VEQDEVIAGRADHVWVPLQHQRRYTTLISPPVVAGRAGSRSWPCLLRHEELGKKKTSKELFETAVG